MGDKAAFEASNAELERDYFGASPSDVFHDGIKYLTERAVYSNTTGIVGAVERVMLAFAAQQHQLTRALAIIESKDHSQTTTADVTVKRLSDTIGTTATLKAYMDYSLGYVLRRCLVVDLHSTMESVRVNVDRATQDIIVELLQQAKSYQSAVGGEEMQCVHPDTITADTFKHLALGQRHLSLRDLKPSALSSTTSLKNVLADILPASGNTSNDSVNAGSTDTKDHDINSLIAKISDSKSTKRLSAAYQDDRITKMEYFKILLIVEMATELRKHKDRSFEGNSDGLQSKDFRVAVQVLHLAITMPMRDAITRTLSSYNLQVGQQDTSETLDISREMKRQLHDLSCNEIKKKTVSLCSIHKTPHR
jgi:hypothetical protein